MVFLDALSLVRNRSASNALPWILPCNLTLFYVHDWALMLDRLCGKPSCFTGSSWFLLGQVMGLKRMCPVGCAEPSTSCRFRYNALEVNLKVACCGIQLRPGFSKWLTDHKLDARLCLRKERQQQPGPISACSFGTGGLRSYTICAGPRAAPSHSCSADAAQQVNFLSFTMNSRHFFSLNLPKPNP